MNLSQIIEPMQTAIFEEFDCYYAFGQKAKYEAEKRQPTKVVHLFGGLYCPKDNAKEVLKQLSNAADEAIIKHKSLYSKERIIRDMLYNKECFYTGEFSEIYGEVAAYGWTPEDVRSVYIETVNTI